MACRFASNDARHDWKMAMTNRARPGRRINPNRTVYYGEPTTDEMMYGWIDYTAAKPSPVNRWGNTGTKVADGSMWEISV